VQFSWAVAQPEYLVTKWSCALIALYPTHAMQYSPKKVPAVNGSSQSRPEGDCIFLEGFNYAMKDQSHTYSRYEKTDDASYGVYP
jgi:hypothetical protein